MGDGTSLDGRAPKARWCSDACRCRTRKAAAKGVVTGKSSTATSSDGSGVKESLMPDLAGVLAAVIAVGGIGEIRLGAVTVTVRAG